RERLHRRHRALRAEQEAAQITDHVALAAVDGDVVGAVADDIGHRLFRVQRFAELAEVADLDAGAQLHRALQRFDLAEQDPKQRALADAVVADEADAVAAHDLDGEVAEQDLVAVAVRDAAGLDDLAARLLGLLDGDAGLLQGRDPAGTLLAHVQQCTHAVLVAVPAGLDALADPDLFLVQLLVEEAVVLLLLGEQLVLAFQVLQV